MDKTLGKPYYILIYNFGYLDGDRPSRVLKGTEYVFNGQAFSPKHYNSETNGGWTVSQEYILHSGNFIVKI